MTHSFLAPFAAAAYPCYWRAADGEFWMNDAAAAVDDPLYGEGVIRRLLADLAAGEDHASPWVGPAQPWLGDATRLWGLSVLPLEGGLLAARTGGFELPAATLTARLRDSLTNIFYALPNLARHAPDEAEEDLEGIRDNCYTLLRLAGNLENAASAAGPLRDVAPLDLGALLERTVSAVESVLPGRDIPIALSLPEEPLFIQGNARLLEDVVLNILRNSLQYTKDGNRIQIGLRRAGKRAVLLIEDAGLGIRSEVLGRVFEPYFSADPYGDGSAPGLGLGLAVAREAARSHGGAITCESRPGEGTAVSLSLPLDEGALPLGSRAAPPLLNRFSPVFIHLEGLCLPPELENPGL